MQDIFSLKCTTNFLFISTFLVYILFLVLAKIKGTIISHTYEYNPFDLSILLRQTVIKDEM